VFCFEFAEIVSARHTGDLAVQIPGPFERAADEAVLLVIEETKPRASVSDGNLKGQDGKQCDGQFGEAVFQRKSQP
jgi:hypothetical protein